MSEKQPEALRLAAVIEQFGGATAYHCAAELRRLHAENAALLADRRNLGAAIERQYSAAEQIADRVMQLEDQCGAMLDALKELLDREWQDDEGDYTLEMARRKARAAIAKAEGENQ